MFAVLESFTATPETRELAWAYPTEINTVPTQGPYHIAAQREPHLREATSVRT